nr:AbiEi antitoxin N-terminal domain-containing protein [Xanthomonas citri]
MGDTRLVSSRWLRAHDYSNSLVARYVGSGWLVSPARGVYMRAGGRLQWDGVVRSLQVGEGMPLHVGDASRWPCKGTSTTCGWAMQGRSRFTGRCRRRAGSASCPWSSASSTRARGHSICR